MALSVSELFCMTLTAGVPVGSGTDWLPHPAQLAVAVAERAPGRAMARRTKRHPPAQPRQRPRQASGAQSHQPFCKRRTSLIHQKSRFCMLAVRTRRLRHQILLVALITMVRSDLAHSSASSHHSRSKSGAPWRAATGWRSSALMAPGWEREAPHHVSTTLMWHP